MKRTVFVIVLFVILMVLSAWLLGCQMASGFGKCVEGAGQDIQWMSKKVQEGDR